MTKGETEAVEPKKCNTCGSNRRVKRHPKRDENICYSCYTGVGPEQMEILELDEFWAQAVANGTAPDHIVHREFRLQRLSASIIEVKDALRDWAKKEMEKEK